jgi:hypothetical protein
MRRGGVGCHRDRRNLLRRPLFHDTCDPRELSVGNDGLILAREGNSESLRVATAPTANSIVFIVSLHLVGALSMGAE